MYSRARLAPPREGRRAYLAIGALHGGRGLILAPSGGEFARHPGMHRERYASHRLRPRVMRGELVWVSLCRERRQSRLALLPDVGQPGGEIALGPIGRVHEQLGEVDRERHASRRCARC